MGFQEIKGSIKGLFDDDYLNDKAVAREHAGIKLPYASFEQLKDRGATLSETFNPGVIMSEYTHTGTFEADVDPKEKIKQAILAHVEEHVDIPANG